MPPSTASRMGAMKPNHQGKSDLSRPSMSLESPVAISGDRQNAGLDGLAPPWHEVSRCRIDSETVLNLLDTRDAIGHRSERRDRQRLLEPKSVDESSDRRADLRHDDVVREA